MVFPDHISSCCIYVNCRKNHFYIFFRSSTLKWDYQWLVCIYIHIYIYIYIYIYLNTTGFWCLFKCLNLTRLPLCLMYSPFGFSSGLNFLMKWSSEHSFKILLFSFILKKRKILNVPFAHMCKCLSTSIFSYLGYRIC